MTVVTPTGLAIRPDPRYVEPPQIPDPRADGRTTVILHGKRVTELSPRGRWPGAELWGFGRCNTFYWHQTLTDWTRWSDLHPVERTPHHKGIKVMRADSWAWYRRQDRTRPIYLLETHPDCPASVAFPRERVQDMLRTTRFTTSADWMIGLALCEGFQRIVLNGMGTRSEADYQYAHKGILYWLGRAEGAGVEVVVEGPSCYHVPTQVYGYESAAPNWALDTLAVQPPPHGAGLPRLAVPRTADSLERACLVCAPT